MTSDFDASGDLAAVADQLEAVTLRRRGGGPAIEIEHALRRAVSAKEIDGSGGKLAVGDLTWHLPAAEAQPAPQIGDVVVGSDARRWTILELVQSSHSGRWRAACRDLALAHGLRDVVRLQRAEWHKGTAGALVATWRDVQFGIAARISAGPAEAVVERDRGALRATFTVLLAEPLPIVGTQRLVDSAGQVYEIVRYEPADRLEVPHAVQVVRSE